MEFFVYHRDRVGSGRLRREMVEEHWSYMDQFADVMIARGPTFTDDGTLTGSVHIVDLAGPEQARAFAMDEPGYQAGIYRDVLVRRWHNTLGRTMWDYGVGQADRDRYLVLGFTPPLRDRPADLSADPTARDETIVVGPMLSDDGSMVLGVAALVEADDWAIARGVLDESIYAGIEVHRWRPGGRPSK